MKNKRSLRLTTICMVTGAKPVFVYFLFPSGFGVSCAIAVVVIGAVVFSHLRHTPAERKEREIEAQHKKNAYEYLKKMQDIFDTRGFWKSCPKFLLQDLARQKNETWLHVRGSKHALRPLEYGYAVRVEVAEKNGLYVSSLSLWKNDQEMKTITG